MAQSNPYYQNSTQSGGYQYGTQPNVAGPPPQGYNMKDQYRGSQPPMTAPSYPPSTVNGYNNYPQRGYSPNTQPPPQPGYSPNTQPPPQNTMNGPPVSAGYYSNTYPKSAPNPSMPPYSQSQFTPPKSNSPLPNAPQRNSPQPNVSNGPHAPSRPPPSMATSYSSAPPPNVHQNPYQTGTDTTAGYPSNIGPTSHAPPPNVSQSFPNQTSQHGHSLPPLPGQQLSAPPSAQPAPPPLPGQQYVPPNPLAAPPLPQPSGAPQAPMTQPPQNNAYQFNGPPPTGSSINRQPGPTPQYPGSLPQPNQPPLSHAMGRMNLSDAERPINLMQEKRLLPPHKHVETPLRFETTADQGMLVPPNRKNCNPSVFCSTLKAVPHTQNLLGKVKLPFGLIIHPFKDLSSLPVISAGTIVRCKRCRTYINPFVSFLQERKWRCNMCFMVNDTAEEFLHHPVTKTYGEPHTRPECTNSTIEFIAPQEYMLRPPQPAVYLFLMDVSHSAIESGYLQIVCDSLLDHLDHMPGDGRTRIGFLTYNGTVHFYRLSEGLSQPQMIIVSDIDDVFIPTPENLLVNLRESKSLVQDLLHQLPLLHTVDAEGEIDTYSALGAALEVAKKLIGASGGRVTVFQQAIPSIGPGMLKKREDPNARAGEQSTTALNPSTDYYKKLALDCSAQQVAIDFFFFNSQYIDIATLSCASRFSAGDMHYYPSLHTVHNPIEAERLSRDLERYLSRKIGFESVMRIRCTKGLAIHTFHGNFFVRSTDLLSLANINPDAGYAVNLSIEDPLTDLSAVCFQAALLYTTSKGERRIRVHTLCIPVVKSPAEVFNSVDCVAVISLLSKMAVDRSVTASVSDAREALMNALVDPLKAYKETLPQGMTTAGVYVPKSLRLLPLYIQCLLKHRAFRTGISTRLDDRVFAMINFKMQPALYQMLDLHPDLYRVDDLNDEGVLTVSGREIPQPHVLPLTAESLSQSGAFLLDCGWKMYLLVGRLTSQSFIKDVLDYPQFSNIEEPLSSIPELENPSSEMFHSFVDWLQENRPHHAPISVIRDDSRDRQLVLSRLIQDRTESSMSMQEFLMNLQQKLT
uniref:protein transport protein Sec24A isoform X1 n=1 Tax=Ciona intestinalis TaxID=7719 RepID=UPI00089DA86F|nr:protein transport protein Sec24A isoform X1 [Ciona intestinalis]|eukprot:XP_018670361.1 protein transport protein Sec24A isoform X1 [Ciona intestinalis]